MGTEDLGGGLKASFKLESGIDLSNGGFDNPGGGHGLFNRIATVALSSDRFLEVTAGLQISLFFETIFDLDPRSAAQMGSILVPVVDNSMIAGLFMPNSVMYKSPSLDGFQVSGLFGLGAVPGDFQEGRSWSVSGKYTNGTLLVAASYIDVNNAGDATLGALNAIYLANVRAWTAGATSI
ncbi:porin [Paraburkholderia dipogonis]|uniref:Porin n=1 Tax=Paraburkholderia dipogonis TaxID=1211383 RepID=A0A4Y8MKX5_9BURK|nr:porin [Paraburkholderia dipogonis]TFE38065.1 porin [Paraburkholderia dipogonis]